MTDSTKETEQRNENQKNDSDSKKKPRLLRGCLWFCLVVAFLLVACALYLHSKITAPIDVKNASTVQAVGWLTMRDLSQETPQKRQELFEMYSGGGSIPNLESDEELKLPDGVQKMADAFMRDREKKLQTWAQSRKRPPYLRLDYLVVPNPREGRSSQYVVSDDVQPGPSLKKRWTIDRESAQRGGAPEKSIVEKNVHLLVMQWFVARMNEYDATPDENKRQKLESVANELERSQAVYNKFRGVQNALTRVRSLREFEATMESWNEFATVEELAKTLWFKDLLISATALKNAEYKGNVAPYPPRLPEKYRATSETEGNAQDARSKFGENAKPICDFVRSYFFDPAK